MSAGQLSAHEAGAGLPARFGRGGAMDDFDDLDAPPEWEEGAGGEDLAAPRRRKRSGGKPRNDLVNDAEGPLVNVYTTNAGGETVRQPNIVQCWWRCRAEHDLEDPALASPRRRRGGADAPRATFQRAPGCRP